MANVGVLSRSNDPGSGARRQRRISWTLSVILAIIYLGFLALIIVAPEAMSANIGGNFTPGLALGAFAILATLLLGCYYVAQANRYDIERARRS